MDLDRVCEEILVLYRAVDSAAGSFSKLTGLNCPAGCGQCCESPEIQATALEMLPMARSIIDSNRNDSLGDLEAGVCIFFQKGTRPGQGRCGAYEFRPLVCRLFGYAARRNKTGQSEFAPCRVHRQDPGKALDHARAMPEMAPDFGSEFTKLASLDPAQGWELLPINTALKRALERVYLHRMRRD